MANCCPSKFANHKIMWFANCCKSCNNAPLDVGCFSDNRCPAEHKPSNVHLCDLHSGGSPCQPVATAQHVTSSYDSVMTRGGSAGQIVPSYNTSSVGGGSGSWTMYNESTYVYQSRHPACTECLRMWTGGHNPQQRLGGRLGDGTAAEGSKSTAGRLACLQGGGRGVINSSSGGSLFLGGEVRQVTDYKSSANCKK